MRHEHAQGSSRCRLKTPLRRWGRDRWAVANRPSWRRSFPFSAFTRSGKQRRGVPPLRPADRPVAGSRRHCGSQSGHPPSLSSAPGPLSPHILVALLPGGARGHHAPPVDRRVPHSMILRVRRRKTTRLYFQSGRSPAQNQGYQRGHREALAIAGYLQSERVPAAGRSCSLHRDARGGTSPVGRRPSVGLPPGGDSGPGPRGAGLARARHRQGLLRREAHPAGAGYDLSGRGVLEARRGRSRDGEGGRWPLGRRPEDP